MRERGEEGEEERTEKREKEGTKNNAVRKERRKENRKERRKENKKRNNTKKTYKGHKRDITQPVFITYSSPHSFLPVEAVLALHHTANTGNLLPLPPLVAPVTPLYLYRTHHTSPHPRNTILNIRVTGM